MDARLPHRDRFDRRTGLIDPSMRRFAVATYVAALVLHTLLDAQAGRPASNDNPKPSYARTIAFSGFEWEVKASDRSRVGPEPNYF